MANYHDNVHSGPLQPTPPRDPEMPLETHFNALRAIPANPTSSGCKPAKPKFPCHLFFYGSLMDPDVLAHITDIPPTRRGAHAPPPGPPPTPTLRPASIKGWKLKMWSIYPTVIPVDPSSVTAENADDTTVRGVTWVCPSAAALAALQHYETKAYVPKPCTITVSETGVVIPDGWTFAWSGKPNSSELREGKFDLEEWQKTMKPF